MRVGGRGGYRRYWGGPRHALEHAVVEADGAGRLRLGPVDLLLDDRLGAGAGAGAGAAGCGAAWDRGRDLGRPRPRTFTAGAGARCRRLRGAGDDEAPVTRGAGVRALAGSAPARGCGVRGRPREPAARGRGCGAPWAHRRGRQPAGVPAAAPRRVRTRGRCWCRRAGRPPRGPASRAAPSAPPISSESGPSPRRRSPARARTALPAVAQGQQDAGRAARDLARP